MKQVIIYTDGACKKNPGPGGYAVITCLDSGVSIKRGYEVETTNNRMELKAVLVAIEDAIMFGFDTICINSDSAYVVNAVNKGWINNWKDNNWLTKSGDDVKNKDLWKKIYRHLNSEVTAIKLNKVKGHDGNYFNEMADKHASAAAEHAKALANKQ